MEFFNQRSFYKAFKFFVLFILSIKMSYAQNNEANRANLPMLFEAENYANFNNTQTNLMLVSTNDGNSRLKVGYNDIGDWYEYLVNVNVSGEYEFEFRVSNGTTNDGQLQILSNSNLVGNITIPQTNGWESFQTVSTKLNLSSGKQTLRIYVASPGVDINWINTNSITSPNLPPVTIPNKIEAESFASFSNIQADKMLVPTSDGDSGLKVGYNDVNDWYEYKVNVTESANYEFDFRVSNGLATNGGIQVLSNGSPVKSIIIPSTNNWESFQNVKFQANLNQGEQTIRLLVLKSGVDINWFSIKKVVSTTAPTADFIVKSMGPGFNLGNVFDLGLNSTDFTSFKFLIDAYVNQGMQHIRIPTSWIEHVNGDAIAEENGNLKKNHPRFKSLETTINYCLDAGLYVVLNTHHERWLKEHYDGSNYLNNRFANLWKNIANHFEGYSDKLIFEVLNEPEGNMGQWDGPGGAPDPMNPQQLAYTRQIMRVGYNAIRATGGNNSTRLIMLATNAQGNHTLIDEVYRNKNDLPGNGNDEYLAIQVHTYDPWQFCGQDGNNSNYPGATTIENSIITTYNHAQTLGVPLHYGEFGVGRRNNQAERNSDIVREFYRVIANITLNNDMAFTIWDDRGWFRLINDDGTFTYNIVPFMLGKTSVKKSNLNTLNGDLKNINTNVFKEIEVYNRVGELVLKKEINPNNLTEITNLKKGLYFIKLQKKTGEVVQQKLLKK
ncbi:carbohydrate-binding protein [Tenacibaculum sp. M341]|uniref:carbohydrate-binding protein n=1 Tax=Tenacibaculum sp. M341 TaxID=2530339 RepID=UPI001050FF51|nr:carbohydrate-binding protein [Tenacibaculum sp. M341]TCI84921.1 carbohydrate-binding protein [Tenacibaculum sp. M341]